MGETTNAVGVAPFLLAFMPNIRVLDITHETADVLLPWMLSESQGLEIDMMKKMLKYEHEDSDYDEDNLKRRNELDQHNSESIEGITKSANYGLSHLTEVRLRTSYGYSGALDIGAIEPILLHPTLKRLWTFGIDWADPAVADLSWPDRPSNLDDLELKDCFIDSTGLRSILTRCNKLRRLAIELTHVRRIRSETYPQYEYWEIDFDELGIVLKELGSSLEEFDFDSYGYELGNGQDGRLGSLQQLSSLRRLRAFKNDLLGDEIDREREETPNLALRETLPRCLETLHLYLPCHSPIRGADARDREDTYQELFNLVTQNEFPNLRQITVEHPPNPSNLGEWYRVIEGWIDRVEDYYTKRSGSGETKRTVLILSKR